MQTLVKVGAVYSINVRGANNSLWVAVKADAKMKILGKVGTVYSINVRVANSLALGDMKTSYFAESNYHVL